MNEGQINILSYLKSSKQAQTINEIASALDLERHTTAKYLESLQAMGLCEYKPVGKSKVWSTTPSALFTLLSKDNPLASELKDVLKHIDETIALQTNDFEIMWSNKPQQQHKKCHEVFANSHTPCQNCGLADKDNTSKEFHGTCCETNITSLPIKDKDKQVIATMTIRK